MASEKDTINPLLVAASRLGARLFRQNTGKGWVGKVVQHRGDQLTLASPRVLHAGLCTGSSDVIGWTPVEVTPEMVGRTVAVFTAIEAKTKGVAVTEEQQRFLKAVHAAGGFAGVAYSTDEALAILRPK